MDINGVHLRATCRPPQGLGCGGERRSEFIRFQGTVRAPIGSSWASTHVDAQGCGRWCEPEQSPTSTVTPLPGAPAISASPPGTHLRAPYRPDADALSGVRPFSGGQVSLSYFIWSSISPHLETSHSTEPIGYRSQQSRQALTTKRPISPQKCPRRAAPSQSNSAAGQVHR